jgi:hypothetical protein
MFKRLTHVLLLFALLFAMGGQHLVLQSIAWTTMLANNLSSFPLQEAVSKTFDGKHPCCICKAVEAGRNSEQKKEFAPLTFKLEFPLLGENPFLAAPSQFSLLPAQNISAKSFLREPVTPPPRGFAA